MHRMFYLVTITVRIDVIKKAYRKLALKWHPGNILANNII